MMQEARKVTKKTPEQVKVLEDAFLQETNPDEAAKLALASQTGLTVDQVNVWFSHRRRKDKKEQQAHTPWQLEDEEGYDDIDVDELSESNQEAFREMKQIIEIAKGRLESYREDGPPLGLYFDEVPARPVYGVKDSGGAAERAWKAKQELNRLEASIRREQERLVREKERNDTRMAKSREKELVRLENERRKQLERTRREAKKEEERRLKEQTRLMNLQLKEQKRLEAAKEKEMKRLKKLREREEKKKEKEMMKALSKQEKEALRTRSANAAQKDDLDFEWEELVQKYKSENNISNGVDVVEGEIPGLVRPQFPPAGVDMVDLGPEGVGESFQGTMLSSWTFLSSFSEILALDCPSVDLLIRSLFDGYASKDLADIHIALLRLIQVDAEEGNAVDYSANVRGEDDSGGSLFVGPRLLEEAWAWGFDVESWRAHLNEITWPEVCRQLCISAGFGRRRPARKTKKGKNGSGKAGEDLVVGENGKLELQLPPRLSESSVKGACWMVLKDAGYQGLRVEEIAKRIQKMGLRDLRTSRTPETSVAGAMGRDVLFERIAPATYALESFRSRYADLIGKKHGGNETSKDDEDQSAMDEDVPMKDAEEDNQEDNQSSEVEDEEEEDDEDEDMEEDQDNLAEQNTESHEGEAWLAKLKESSYDALTLDEKSVLLGTLCQLALDSTTVRLVINGRQEEQMRIKRSKIEDDKLESSLLKHRRQLEQLVNARKNALQAEQELKQVHSAPESKPQAEASGSSFEKSKAEIDLEAKVASAEKKIMGFTGQKNGITNEMLKERARKRADEALRDLNMNSVRFEPLGCDRRYNKYYRFCSDGVTPGNTKGRICFENSQTGQLKAIVSEQALQELIGSLNPKGPRERELKASLVRVQSDSIANMPSSSWNELNGLIPTKVALNSISLCPSANSITGSVAGSQSQGDIVSKVRDAIDTICKALEERQLKPSFNKDDFVSKLHKSESLGDLKQCLGDLEASIVPEYVHSGFPLEPLLVRGAWISIGAEVATALPGSTIADVMLPMSPDPKTGAPKLDTQDGRDALAKRVPLSWLPETPASMALRVLALDTAIRYRNDDCGRDTMTEFQFSLRPCRLRGSKNGLVESMSVRDYGRIDPTHFAKFPYRLLFGPRVDFEISKEELLSDIQKQSDEPLSSVLYKRQPVGTGRGRGRGRGRGSRRISAGRGEEIKRQDTEEKVEAQEIKEEAVNAAPVTANRPTPEQHVPQDSSSSSPSPSSSSDLA